MLRKRKIKAIYINEVICDKCGRPMEDTGRIALTSPAKYIFQCLHCHEIGYLREDQKYEIEFEEDDQCITQLS